MYYLKIYNFQKKNPIILFEIHHALHASVHSMYWLLIIPAFVTYTVVCPHHDTLHVSKKDDWEVKKGVEIVFFFFEFNR